MIWVAVVLAAVVDGHPDPEDEGGFPVLNRLAPEAAVLVGGDAVVGVEPVKGVLGVADGVPLKVGMGVAEHMG
jgi:hypothetical protein